MSGKVASIDTTDGILAAQTRRFFATIPPEITVELPAKLLISDAQTVHHLSAVCRAKAGERVVLTDPQREVAYAATVDEVSRHHLLIILDALLPATAKTLPPVTLIAALIKEQRWDPLLQRCTELGVRSILPVTAERSIVRLDPKEAEKKRSRWQGILQSAAEQSEGLFIPKLHAISTSVQDLAQQFLPEGEQATGSPLKILLMERGQDRTPLKRLLQQETALAIRPVYIAIGPEGGWSDTEAETFQSMGFHFASLGDRILRSETAAMAAMAALVYESC
jgi:16S rRNA (uracil1498-N3)-methyltransferase